MGSHAVVPNDEDPTEEADTTRGTLGDLLAGRLSDVRVDSVEAVREIRERE